jgi:stage II sporulation protein M
MRKTKFNLAEEYKKCFSYIRKSLSFIYLIVGIFLLFSLIGFFISPPANLQNQIFNFISELFKQTEGMSQFELIRFIFLNNIQSSFIGLFSGIFLGIFPVISAIFNGYILGFVSSYSVQERGFSSLWALSPHGIFEIPAIFISFGLGLKLSSFLFQKDKIKSLRFFLVNSFWVFVLIDVPLLVIAAIIEGSLISLFS